MLRICSHDGCPNPVPKGYCRRHRESKPRSPSSSITGTSKWRKLKTLILKRDRWLCHYCGGKATSVDHVIPISRGGAPFDETNLVASCLPCNMSKSNKL